jgi:competence protein ComEC
MENIINIDTREVGIFVFIWGFVTGILIGSFFFINFYISLFLIFLGSTISIVEKINSKIISKQTILVSIALISLGLGLIRYEYKNQRNINQSIESQIGKKIEVEGLVIGEPDKKDNVTQIIVLPENSKEKILVNTDLYSHVTYGDIVKVSGKLQKPGIIKGDDGRNFNYGDYLAKDDIYYTISFAEVETLSSNNGNFIKANLFKIKNKFIDKIRSLFPEPEASLLAGLTLSGKDSLPKSILEEFRRAGIVHIVVLSGYNITIVAEFFLKIFGFLSIRLAALSAGGSIILFTLMTGGQATVVRAALMGLTLLLGKIIGRGYSAPRALLVAAFLMLLENPKILVFDSSFKLSFLATIALMYAVPIINDYLDWMSKKGGLRSIISTTIGTQIVVLPYILYTMGNFSVVALASNILTLIFIPITMLLGFAATLLGFINDFLAIPLTFTTHLLLYWILLVGERLGNLLWGSFEIRAFPLWIVLLWYTVYIGIYFHVKNNPQSKTQFIYKPL